MAIYNVKETEYPARSRSSRRRQAGVTYTGTSASPVVGGVGSGTPAPVPEHDLLAGITSIDGAYPETARGIHLTAAAADQLKSLLANILTVLTTADTTTPAADNNVFSALRTLVEIANRAISKTEDDTAAGVISFMEGMRSNNHDPLSPFGPGMSLRALKDVNGNHTGYWELIVDYLKVNAKATFKEILVEQISHVGGSLLLSPASMECTEVVQILDTDGITVTRYRCYMDENKTNRWKVGDQALCQQFLLPTTRRYWRYVVAVGDHYIDLSATDCEPNSDIPQVDDNIIQFGSRTDSARRSAILITSYGDAGPSITMYKNIGVLLSGETSPYTLTNRAKTSIGATESRFVGKLIVEGEDGEEYRVPADRGDWSPGAYYYYDRVRYDNAQWLCVAIPSTTLEPSDSNSSVWKKELSSGNGTPGNWVSQVFKESYDQPEAPTGTDPIPSGWIDGPTGPGTWWMSKATVNGSTGLAGAWSVPIQVSGANGTKTPFRFAKNTSMDVYPTIDVANINPGEAWLVAPPTAEEGEYIWMTKAEIRTMAQDAEGNVFDDIFSDEFWGAAALERIDQLVANWSVPVRISGEKGSDGKDGKDYEYIFSRTGTAVAPTRPSTSQDDDFVPLGWTDDPKGTDAANVYEWVCKRIKVNGVWSEFSSPALWSKWSRDGEDGDPGADAIEASLSNAQHNIPTDFNGNNGNFTGAACTMYIYKGIVDDSVNWEVSIVKSAGVTGSLSGKTYSITGLSTDNGYVDFTASRTGYASITKRMTLTKSKTGEPGVTPTAYWLVTPPSVARSSAGVYTPASFTVYSYKSVSATPELHPGQFVISETEDGSTYIVKYTSSANESGKTYTPSSATVKSFKVTLRKSVTDSAVLDDQVIPVVMQGANGADGISYMLSANANVVTKTVALSTVTYTPSTLSFNPRKRAGSAVPVAPSDCSLRIQGWNGTGWVDISNVASVTELTYSVSVSATYTQYRAQLYLSAVMVQELVVNVVEDAKSGKDALAFVIGGYSSYEAYVADAVQYGKTLMAGGYLKNDIIDTVSLFAKALQISVIADLVGTQFDANLVTVMQKLGMIFPASINGIETNLSITPQSLPDVAAFLAGTSVSGSNSLTSFSGENWVPSGVTYGDKTKISPTYQIIPAGVSSLKWNAINLAATFTVPSGGSGDVNRRGGLWISLYAHFYNGTTYLGRQFMGTVGGMSETRVYSLSGAIPSGTCSTPVNANRVYLYAQFSCSVEFSSQAAPTCTLSFTALASSAYFINATGVYKGQITPDGIAYALNSSKYFHLKTGVSDMLLSYMGNISSNSISMKLLNLYVAANGTVLAHGGYAYNSARVSISKVGTGHWRIYHYIKSDFNIGQFDYMPNLICKNSGHSVYPYLIYDDYIEIRAKDVVTGNLADSEFYLEIKKM